MELGVVIFEVKIFFNMFIEEFFGFFGYSGEKCRVDLLVVVVVRGVFNSVGG